MQDVYLQDGLHDHHTHELTSLYRPLPHWIVLVCAPDTQTTETMLRDIQGSAIKNNCSFHLVLSLDHLSGESSLPCLEDTQAALCRGPHGEKLWPPNSQHQLASHVSERLRSNSLASAICSPGHHPDDYFTRHPKARITQQGHSWIPDPQTMCGLINAYYRIQPPSADIIRYAARDN